MAGQGRSLVPSFRNRKGCWRPDYLMERFISTTGETSEKIRVCEINSRFPYNGFFIVSHIAKTFAALGVDRAGLKTTTNLDVSENAFLVGVKRQTSSCCRGC